MHKVTREGDEMVCSCGLRWGIDEADPHYYIGVDPAKPGADQSTLVNYPAGLTKRVGLKFPTRKQIKKYIDGMREALRK